MKVLSGVIVNICVHLLLHQVVSLMCGVQLLLHQVVSLVCGVQLLLHHLVSMVRGPCHQSAVDTLLTAAVDLLRRRRRLNHAAPWLDLRLNRAAPWLHLRLNHAATWLR